MNEIYLNGADETQLDDILCALDELEHARITLEAYGLEDIPPSDAALLRRLIGDRLAELEWAEARAATRDFERMVLRWPG